MTDAGGGERRPEGLAAAQARLAAFAEARAWGPYHTPKNLAAALSVEASELLEIFQWLTPDQAARIMDDPADAFRVRDEVADVLAYLLQFCEAVGVDPVAALHAKIDRNESRFPLSGAAAGSGPAGRAAPAGTTPAGTAPAGTPDAAAEGSEQGDPPRG